MYIKDTDHLQASFSTLSWSLPFSATPRPSLAAIADTCCENDRVRLGLRLPSVESNAIKDQFLVFL